MSFKSLKELKVKSAVTRLRKECSKDEQGKKRRRKEQKMPPLQPDITILCIHVCNFPAE